MKNYIFIVIICYLLSSFVNSMSCDSREQANAKRLMLLEILFNAENHALNSSSKMPSGIQLISNYLKSNKKINMPSLILFEQRIQNYVQGLYQRGKA